MATPFYQPVVDALRVRPGHEALLRVLRLCQAVEAEDRGKIMLLTGPVVKTVNSRVSPVGDLPPEVFYETLARMLFAGVESDFFQVIEWYERRTILSLARTERITENWENALALIVPTPPGLKEQELNRRMLRLRDAFRIVLTGYADAEVEAGPPRPPRIINAETVDIRERGFGTAVGFRPTRLEVLEAGIEKLVWDLMTVYQPLYEGALAHLNSRKADRGAKLLALRALWDEVIRTTFGRYPKSLRLPKVPVKLARIRYGRSPRHRYVDAFPPHDARTFGFTPYNREPPENPPGKSAWLLDVFRYRAAQMTYLLDDLGEAVPSAGPVADPQADRRMKDKFKERRSLIDRVEKAGAPLDLKTLDDLIKFGCAFHDALRNHGPHASSPDRDAKAWLELLRFLSRRIQTHTAPAEFNLDEEPSYFDRDLPRAIHGGVLQDCGVYAVYMAYVLLSLAHCARGRVRIRAQFILFPLHVGLLIDIDGLPPVVLHNDALVPLRDDQLRPFRQEWDAAPDHWSTDPAGETQRRLKFLEDVAAQMYIRDVDMPFIRIPIAPVSTPPRKQQIWRIYRGVVVPTLPKMFSRNIENSAFSLYQFDIKYLRVAELEKEWHNTQVVPFWNVACHTLWIQTGAGVPTEVVLQRSPARRKVYADRLEALIKAVDENYDKEVRPAKDALTRELRANSGVVGRAIRRVTTAARLVQSVHGLGPVGEARTHLEEIRKGIVNVPNFAHDREFLRRHPE